MILLATWTDTLIAIAIAVVIASLAYTGLRYLGFRRYRKRLREVTKREALSLERQRIGMDVHDDLGADLSNLLLRIRMALAQGGDLHTTLQEMEVSITGMMRKIDEIIWSLDPRMDSLNSTIGFIEQHVGEMVDRAGLTFRCTRHAPGLDRTVSAGFRRDLHLMVREAVQNVLKHAEATEVHLNMDLQGSHLHLVVEDNGRGLPDLVTPQRHGRDNMHRRAMKLAGSIALSAIEPRGTRCEIKVRIPQYHPKG